MAKQIIVLDKIPESGLYRGVLWADVPLGRQAFYAKTGAVSVWTGASGAENTAIAAGQVAEKVITLSVSDGATLAQLKAAFIEQQVLFQTFVTTYNPWSRYGSFYDGTVWTAGGAT